MSIDSLFPLFNTALIFLGGGIGVYLWRAEKRLRLAQADSTSAEADLTKVNAAEKIKEMSLSLIAPLERKIEDLEAEITRLRERIEGYIKDEAAYQAELHAKQREIEELKVTQKTLRARVQHLEEVCQRAGINGDEYKWDGNERRQA